MAKRLVSVVIGSYNRAHMLRLCIDAVRKELENIDHEIIVVDGGSNDGSVQWLVAQKDIITILQHNRGEWRGNPIQRRSWAYFMNLGFKASEGKYICMLSDDSLIVPGAIKNGIRFFEEKLQEGRKVGGVAFHFRDYPLRKKYAVAENLGHIYVNHGLYLNDAMKEVGYASDDEYHFYFADTDLILKMKEIGYECLPCEFSFVEHYFDATPDIRQSNNDSRKLQDRAHLINKWCGRMYPANQKKNYERHVGRWREIEYSDSYNTIRKLVPSNKVTVVTVTYNSDEELKRTIQSVEYQSYGNIEYVIIDGASRDDTVEIVERHRHVVDSRISQMSAFIVGQ